MNDILRTLRIIYEDNGPVECGEAADEIERLRDWQERAVAVIKNSLCPGEDCPECAEGYYLIAQARANRQEKQP